MLILVNSSLPSWRVVNFLHHRIIADFSDHDTGILWLETESKECEIFGQSVHLFLRNDFIYFIGEGENRRKEAILREKRDVCLDFETNAIFRLLVFSTFHSVTTLLC